MLIVCMIMRSDSIDDCVWSDVMFITYNNTLWGTACWWRLITSAGAPLSIVSGFNPAPKPGREALTDDSTMPHTCNDCLRTPV